MNAEARPRAHYPDDPSWPECWPTAGYARQVAEFERQRFEALQAEARSRRPSSFDTYGDGAPDVRPVAVHKSGDHQQVQADREQVRVCDDAPRATAEASEGESMARTTKASAALAPATKEAGAVPQPAPAQLADSAPAAVAPCSRECGRGADARGRGRRPVGGNCGYCAEVASKALKIAGVPRTDEAIVEWCRTHPTAAKLSAQRAEARATAKAARPKGKPGRKPKPRPAPPAPLLTPEERSAIFAVDADAAAKPRALDADHESREEAPALGGAGSFVCPSPGSPPLRDVEVPRVTAPAASATTPAEDAATFARLVAEMAEHDRALADLDERAKPVWAARVACQREAAALHARLGAALAGGAA